MEDYNLVKILMKVDNFIDIQKTNNYKKTNLKTYQQLIEKLIYLLYRIRLNIAFVVDQFNRQNTDSYNDHFKVKKTIVCHFKDMIQL